MTTPADHAARCARYLAIYKELDELEVRRSTLVAEIKSMTPGHLAYLNKDLDAHQKIIDEWRARK